MTRISAPATSSLDIYFNTLANFERIQSVNDFPPLLAIINQSESLTLPLRASYREKWRKKSETAVDSLDCKSSGSWRFADILLQSDLFSERCAYFFDNAESYSDLAAELTRFKSLDRIVHCGVLFFSKKPSDKIKKQILRLQIDTITCEDPKPFELPKYITTRARTLGVPLTSDAVKLLLESCGNDIGIIDNNLRQLVLLASHGKEQPLTAQDLSSYFQVVREDIAFKLRDLLIDGQKAAAQLLVSELVARGESPLAILGILSKHIRDSITTLSAGTTAQSSVSGSFIPKLPPFVLKRYTVYSQKMGSRKLRSALATCAEADRILKSSRLREDLVLSNVVMRMVAS